MLTPSSLYPGAKVALLCPSSSVAEDRLEPMVADIKALGLEPVVYPSCYYVNHHGIFAADDAQRAKDLQDAFADPEIKGILCLRGGNGAPRLLPLLDWKEIARHPKPFYGYSDLTNIHIVLNQRCRMVSYHTPMPIAGWYGNGDEFTLTYLRKALFGALSGPLPLGETAETLQGGKARGQLCGGNLARVRDSLGTPWELDTRGKLLFLEDVDLPLWQIDNALTQLRNAGKLDECAGILLGKWVNCTAPDDQADSLTIEEIIEELVLPSNKPVLSGLPCGHSLPTMSLPLGAVCAMDADASTLEVLD